MARFPFSSASTWSTAVVSFLALSNTLISPVQAQDSEPATVRGTDANGVTRTLLDSRNPALYTGDFGDCMGGQSLLNVTAFDAAYYADNMTVLFHLAGSTSLRNESVMLYISVQAYGEDRFDLTFNPCSANIASLCPMNNSIPISAEAIIPVSSSDVSGIPSIALVIPDFEGSAQLRIFANSSQTQIGCFEAVMRNGATFSHPAAVSSALGAFTAIALLASFATLIYGASIPQIRTHYAHSLSVLVVFEVFQSIFFSGALSLNWPSVCAAFWSNFAWSAGMIYSPSIIKSVNDFIGVNGNSSQVGGAGSTALNNNGGLQQQIYGRSLEALYARDAESVEKGHEVASRIFARAENSSVSKSYHWAGSPIDPGILVPGNWSGFAGELSVVDIPAADAFLTGLIWFIILVVILVGATVLFKWSLESLSAINLVKKDRFATFRTHWLGFTGLIVLRSFFIAFFMMMTLTLFQFSYGGNGGVIAVASIIFLIFFGGILGLAFLACFIRLRLGRYESSPGRLHLQRQKGIFPRWKTVPEEEAQKSGATTGKSSLPFFRVKFVDNNKERLSVHEDPEFIKKFGWLSARYRRTRWWFFAFWVVYQFVRACFIGGARASPSLQVYGIFVVEIIAFIAIVWMNPFEGRRNTALAVWMLGISKVATAGLSIAFLPQHNVARIPTTVIGIIIIIIQGFLTIGVLILIVLGAISTYMSLTRNREHFRPHGMQGVRNKYLAHLEKKAADLPPPPTPEPEEPKEPYFSVKTVRRAPKIEDEDVEDVLPDMENPAMQSTFSLGNRARANSMANSMRSNHSTVPYGARVHRASWSSRDFTNWQQQENGAAPYDTPSRVPSRNVSGHNTANNSVSMTGASGVPLVRPSASHSSLRQITPTKEQQQAFAAQRVASNSSK
ncbi:transient receptor potential ion channel [Phlyctema vagabunda]|uniref:Transient receptor potential ion channel n=1 Tax=Phlyctema vagabunda TaxID=108571 RepID=A0ABR4PT87_9HELO